MPIEIKQLAGSGVQLQPANGIAQQAKSFLTTAPSTKVFTSAELGEMLKCSATTFKAAYVVKVLSQFKAVLRGARGGQITVWGSKAAIKSLTRKLKNEHIGH